MAVAAWTTFLLFGFVSAAGAVQWPSDDTLRYRILEKRGQGLSGPKKAQQITKLKASDHFSEMIQAVPQAHALRLRLCTYGSGRLERTNTLQGITWAYDWRLGEDQAFVDACAANGVEYVPMIVSAALMSCPCACVCFCVEPMS